MKLWISLKESRYMQYVSAIIGMLSMASVTMHITWPSPTLPQLTSEDSPIGTTITGNEGSWVASSFLLGTLPGFILAAWFVEKFGRKAALMLSVIPLTLPWYGIVYAKSALALCIYRFIGGSGLALVVTVAPMYNGEIAEKDIRGILGNMFSVLRLAGNLYVLSVGPFVSYTALALSCSAFPIIFVVLFFFMPESPYYLVKVGKDKVARQNLVRLSSNLLDDKAIDEKLQDINKTVEIQMENRSSIWKVISAQEYRKSLLIALGLKSLQQLCGITAFESYMQTIIESSDSSISPEISSIIAGVIQFPSVLVTAFLVDKVGRRPLLIISALGCGVALIGEGVYFYLRNVAHADVSNIAWLPTTAMLFYLLMNPIGVATLPWVLLGELFPVNIKGIAVSICTFYGSVLAFLTTKFFQPISEAWGLHVTFWIFATVCLLGAVIAFFFMPETKGKTFIEIQDGLHKRNFTENKTNVEAQERQ